MASKDYFDEHGLIHPQAGVKSENGILFRAILDNFTSLNGEEFYPGYQNAAANTIVNGRRYQANPPENGDHFSRDNMLGLYCLCKIHGMKFTIKHLPLVRWNGKINWHPNTWAVFMAFKWPIFKWNPIIYIMALYSLLSTDYKNTSGKNIWFLTLTVLNIYWPLKLAQWRYLRYGIFFRYKYLFKESHVWYFTNGFNYRNADNPILNQVNEFYSKCSEGINKCGF